MDSEWTYDPDHLCFTRVLPDGTVEWAVGIDPATDIEEEA